MTTKISTGRHSRGRSVRPANASAIGIPPRSREAGFTLIESLIALILALVVVVGPLSFITYSLTQQNSASSRVAAVDAAEVGLQRLTRDLRQAEQVLSASTGLNTTPVNIWWGGGSSMVSFYIETPGTGGASTELITWTCTAAASCARQVASGAVVTEITGVTSATFTPKTSSGTTPSTSSGLLAYTYTTTNPATVALSLTVQDTSQLDSGRTHVVSGVTNGITIQDAVDLRNYA